MANYNHQPHDFHAHPAPEGGSGPAELFGRRSPKPPMSPWTGLLVDLGWALVATVGLTIRGTGFFGARPDLVSPPLQAAGGLGLVIVLALMPVTYHLRRRASAEWMLARKIEGVQDGLRALSDQAALSDDARRVLNRQHERELLRRAIEEDIHNQAWDAAMVLCSELADRFGYRADAEEFRARIELARAEITERGLTDAVARLDGLIVQRRWDVALREADRIRRLFPDAPRAENLRNRVEQARSVYKQDLERRFLEAASAARIEEAMSLLKELDAYLTEAEAEPFREVARGVITKARENLGAQFKIAVQDRQWAAAAALGRRIVAEFPNTRMAQEVRGMMDGILARANTAATV